MRLTDKKLLVLCPHTDDGELGMGGSIARFIEEGADIYYAAFSTAEKSVPEGFPKDELKREVKRATSKLGIPQDHLHIYPYEVRTFSYHRQELLDDLIKLRSAIDPDIVFIPTLRDLHQDHIVIANEAVRAFKKKNLLAYELPWNNLQFSTDAFVVLEESHIQKKIDALKEYRTQEKRDYMSDSFIFGLARTRGVQIGVEYAECFEVIRWLI